jgi:hypothetical protein
MLEEQDDGVDVDKGGFSFLPIVLDWRMQSLQDLCIVSRRQAMIEKTSKTSTSKTVRPGLWCGGVAVE